MFAFDGELPPGVGHLDDHQRTHLALRVLPPREFHIVRRRHHHALETGIAFARRNTVRLEIQHGQITRCDFTVPLDKNVGPIGNVGLKACALNDQDVALGKRCRIDSG